MGADCVPGTTRHQNPLPPHTAFILPKAEVCVRNHVQPYIPSILEALMVPTSQGFTEVRDVFFKDVTDMNLNVINEGGIDKLGEVRVGTGLASPPQSTGGVSHGGLPFLSICGGQRQKPQGKALPYNRGLVARGKSGYFYSLPSAPSGIDSEGQKEGGRWGREASGVSCISNKPHPAGEAVCLSYWPF